MRRDVKGCDIYRVPCPAVPCPAVLAVVTSKECVSSPPLPIQVPPTLLHLVLFFPLWLVMLRRAWERVVRLRGLAGHEDVRDGAGSGKSERLGSSLGLLLK